MQPTFFCRRRPFLIKSLENTLSKLLKSLDFYDNAARHKVAIGTLLPLTPNDSVSLLTVQIVFGQCSCIRHQTRSDAGDEPDMLHVLMQDLFSYRHYRQSWE